MPKDFQKNNPILFNNIGKIIESDIVPEMEKSYLDYSMSVIVQRALPDVKDGLKPVHRRIIYAMDKMGLSATGKNVKSAAVVGDVMKTYHPHGDMSIYMAIVRMAQEFSLRYPLVSGQGNFGSIDGDPPAAMRYTEVKMTKLTIEMIADINKETVDMADNYDSTTKEPVVLPARIPNLLLNGADGIAVGMATKIPPHNLTELSKALDYILHHSHLEKLSLDTRPIPTNTTPDKILKPAYIIEQQKYNLETEATIENLLKFVSGPDFPTRGEIYGKSGIIDMYSTGRGKFTLRGKAAIEETKSGKIRIIISEIPYQVNKAEMVKKIADLVHDKKIIGISDLRDESDRHGIRVVVELKKQSKPKAILNKLYKYTSLQTSYSANMLALVNGIPQTLNLRQMLLLFLRHRENIARRRTIYDLKAALLRSHILEGLKIALDNLDEVIKTIRASKTAEDAKINLIAKFDFTDIQAIAILEMQLRRLAALERQKIQDEYNEVKKEIDGYNLILINSEKMISVLIAENKEISEKYSDPRKTRIFVNDLEKFSEEDLVTNEKVLVISTKTGYIKRVSKDTYRTQKRGGVGILGMATKNEDEINRILLINTHDHLLFFTNQGRVFQIKVWEINESSRQSKGQSIINLINLHTDEKVQTIISLTQEQKDSKGYIMLATRKGVVKKTAVIRFKKIRQNGLASIKLDQGDQLISAKFTDGNNHVFMVTFNGKCIRFHEQDIRSMGRHSRGVRGIALKDNDYLTSMDVFPQSLESKDKKTFYHLLTVTENGVGKRTNVFLYPLQKRGGVGVKVSNLNAKTGKIADSKVVTDHDNQIIFVSKKAVTIKLTLENIPVLSRNTKGVILMRLKDNDTVSTMTIFSKIIEEN